MTPELLVCGPWLNLKMPERSRHGAKGRSGKGMPEEVRALLVASLGGGLGRQDGGDSRESQAVGSNHDSIAMSQWT